MNRHLSFEVTAAREKHLGELAAKKCEIAALVRLQYVGKNLRERLSVAHPNDFPPQQTSSNFARFDDVDLTSFERGVNRCKSLEKLISGQLGQFYHCNSWGG